MDQNQDTFTQRVVRWHDGLPRAVKAVLDAVLVAGLTAALSQASQLPTSSDPYLAAAAVVFRAMAGAALKAL